MRVGTDGGPPSLAQDAAMTSYAVTWQQGDDLLRSGRLDVHSDGLAFEGPGENGVASELSVEYSDLVDVHIGRTPSERIAGRQTLVLERRAGKPIRIAGVVQPGIVTELAEQVGSQLREEQAMSRAVVVLPLKQGASKQAAELLRHGPPFDPEEVGLERHHVFLTEDEVVFVFEANDLETAERLIGDDGIWEAAGAWKDLVAGPPRVAVDKYSWLRPHVPDDVTFAPTPGPGDSDGGDLSSPEE
jgi:hypothetical protein